MIPNYDSFDWFASLIPALIVLVPLMAAVRSGVVRRAILIFAGLYLLSLIAPRLALFHLVLWLVIMVIQPVISATGERRGGLVFLWAGLTLAIAPMFAWKMWPIDFVINLNVWTNVPFRSFELPAAIEFTAPIVAPIGLSFSAFRAMDLLIKSNLGLVDRLSPGRTLSYGLFPPLLVVGPISAYSETAATLEAPVKVDRARALRGCLLILSGLTKVFVLAYFLSWSGNIFDSFEYNSPGRIWLSLFAFTWFFYFNFAGYSDLAIGSSELLGADVRANFKSPYTKTTPAAFWNSWHISLTRFLRTNVFTPMVARHPQRQYAATAVIMLLIGLWHNIGWASVIFGAYHAVSLIGHRVLESRRPPSKLRIIGLMKPIGIFVWFGLSLPLLRLNSPDAFSFYGSLFGVDL